MKIFVAVLLMACSVFAVAADLTRMSEADPRVRYVTYKVDDVVEVSVRRGVVTRIIFEGDEKILSSGAGFDARCDNNDLEWCVRADRDSNQVCIKARENATHNNIEIATNKRDYSFRLTVLPDAPRGGKRVEEVYRVIFQYPAPPVPLPPAVLAGALPNVPIDERSALSTRLAARPVARNANYSLDTINGGQFVAPTMVFDDGRFTYFRFPNNRDIPAFFAFGADGQEARTNFHVEEDLVVVHRVARKFVLRLGNAVAAVFNDAYDAEGVGTPSGVSVPGLSRDLKSER